MPDILTVIPARGGSTRLRRKNLLPIDGVPMFLRTARAAPGRVVVSTDDPEILSLCNLHGIETHWRETVTDTQTVPEVAKLVATDLEWIGPVLAIQPSTQPTPELGGHPWPTQPTHFTYPTNHLYWYADQRISNPYAEVGIYFWPAGTVGEDPTYHYPVEPVTDIDTPFDYLAASRTRAIIDIVAAPPNTWNGTGHLRRMETLALSLQHHDIEFVPEAATPRKCDLLLIDRGNTLPEDILYLHEYAGRVISFEDLGLGRAYTNLTINALLPPSSLSNVLSGPDYAILRPEFYSLPRYKTRHSPQFVLIMFGGTDAKQLTPWVSNIVKRLGYTPMVHEGPGVAEAMHHADLLICGAGQTVHEAARVGVPTIALAATQREASHGHLGDLFGNIFMGLAATVTEDHLFETIAMVMTDQPLRVELSNRSQSIIDGKGTERVVWHIEGVLRDL